jgi:carboxypeptidase T
MSLYHVTITGRDRRHLTELGPKHRILIVGYREDPKRGVLVDAYLAPGKMQLLRKHGYGVTRLEEVESRARQRQAEGRTAAARRLKRGRYGDVIWAGGYLTADEIERAMVLGVEQFKGYVERIPLPNRTWEKRRCHALRIGKGRGRRRPGICFTGGVHGREWGSADILIYFAVRLLRAYRDRTGIRVGARHYTAAQIREIVEKKDVILVPQVNPDGRHFSMQQQPMWRKNRRPPPRGRGARSIGVDLNRNFPFMWHYERYFAPGTVESSRHPGDFETYVGPRAASEPETRNVIWLLDNYPQIRYFIDLHSYGETILHSWGGDQNQSVDPRMSFANRAFDGLRGRIHDDLYREYIIREDEKTAIRLGRQMSRAIALVRGRKYKVQQSVGLYPVAGCSDDYAYSRHLEDSSKSKVVAFTIEWGRSRCSTPFHPPYPEMRKVMREVAAGLLEFCVRARA